MSDLILKKLLHLEQVRFSLPDDFEGSLSDALRLAADYLEQPKAPIPQPVDKDKPVTNEIAWVEFKEVVTSGRKWFGVVSIVSWNESEKKWDMLPLKTGGGL